MRHPEENCITLSNEAFLELMQAVLARGGSFRFSARGQSMTPFVRDGDTITIAPLAGRSPRLGDVVAFVCHLGNEPGLVVHRIVDRGAPRFVVQGDGDGSAQQIVFPENIIGKLVKVERNGRYVRAGLGPERRLIAWASKSQLFFSLVWPVWGQIKKAFYRQKPGG